jgi:hypothetical protein
VSNERFLAELGLDEAFGRLNHRLLDGTGNEHLISFAECLQWIYSLQELHRSRLPGFYQLAAANLGGEIFSAMVYARGLLTHGMADVTRLTGSRPFRVGVSRLGGGDAIGGSGISVIWADFSALPLPGRPERYGRDVLYRTHLEGQPLLIPFGTVIPWLKALP